MVSTHLKIFSQMGNLPQVGVKIKNVWNHHLDKHFCWDTLPRDIDTYPNLGKGKSSTQKVFIKWKFGGPSWKSLDDPARRKHGELCHGKFKTMQGIGEAKFYSCQLLCKSNDHKYIKNKNIYIYILNITIEIKLRNHQQIPVPICFHAPNPSIIKLYQIEQQTQ